MIVINYCAVIEYAFDHKNLIDLQFNNLPSVHIYAIITVVEILQTEMDTLNFL